MPSSNQVYEQDFHAWTKLQSNLLEQKQWEQLDIANLIEEIESLGRQQQQELRNRLSILLGHLLRWEYQPKKRSHSWLSTIRIQRLDIADLLLDNPSFKAYFSEALTKAYRRALALVTAETELPLSFFPVVCPYEFSQILDDHFYPGEPSHLFSDH
jgi:hypothetical protein